jgi:pyrroline-5-carboxylate reductase
MKFGIIGVGNMGEAILRSVGKKIGFDNIYANDINEEKLNSLKKELNINVLSKENLLNNEEIDYLMLAIKPQSFIEESFEVKNKNMKIISIMAGIKISKIIEKTELNKVVRVMPNLNAQINLSVSGYSISRNIIKKENEEIKLLLETFGIAFEVKEEMLDAVTGISGSGPAYVAYLIDGLAKSAKNQGFETKDALDIAIQTFYGTAKLLKNKKINPGDFIKAVSSKGGTTVAGMEVLKNSEYEITINNTVKAAIKRSKELGQ